MELMITGGHREGPPHLTAPQGWLSPLETGMPLSPASHPHSRPMSVFLAVATQAGQLAISRDSRSWGFILCKAPAKIFLPAGTPPPPSPSPHPPALLSEQEEVTALLLPPGDVAQSPQPAEMREEKQGEKEELFPSAGWEESRKQEVEVKMSNPAPAPPTWGLAVPGTRHSLVDFGPRPSSPRPPLPLVPSAGVMLGAASPPAPAALAQHTPWHGHHRRHPGLSPCWSFLRKPELHVPSPGASGHL